MPVFWSTGHEPLRHRPSRSKFWLPASPTSGVMMPLTKAVTTAPNAAPMTTPTARSTTLPRSTNLRKPSTRSPLLKVVSRECGLRRRWYADQHAGVEHAVRIELALGGSERTRKQLRPLPVVPGPVVPADRVVMGDGPAGGEQGLAGRGLHLV